ncbi:MAG: Flp pilus assembly complex ATPase component TadA [Clostridiaceae bacterium]|jgi:pilus assembly protein CpaF|nr:Flp pilus assembly complex ATPase component TadA [Clostridiaceae bacterium]
MNEFLIVLILSALVMFCVMYYRHNRATLVDSHPDEERYSLGTILQFVREAFNDILKTNLYEMSITKEEFEKRVHNKNQLRKALKTCTYGDMNSKNYIKDFIKDILVNRYQIDEVNINLVLNFDNPKELSAQDKFDILLYHYKKQHGYRALEALILENHLDSPQQSNDGISYIVTQDDIEKIYAKRQYFVNRFEDKLNILAQRLYQLYKGHGVIDEIRDMRIDGVSGGVSGIPSTFNEEIDLSVGISIVASLPSSYDSVWVFFKGKTIHFSFLSFGSEAELIRVCKNIYRYNYPGQLSESNGYKVNEMKDGSRVVVVRPPFAESWAFFVRKFDSIEIAEPEELITDKGREIPIGLIKWLVKGCRITAITGSQGTGKTTLLMAIIKYISPAFTLRIQELAFELHLRRIYPKRNILTFRETPTISGQEGLDLQKKTDGTVNILGEVATAPVSAWMIQMAQVASLFTLFTHHAKSTDNLVKALRNNLLQTGAFSNEKIAEQQVADVINFDIHLTKDITGHRYVERITEVIPVENENYPELKPLEEGNSLPEFLWAAREFFIRMTDRKVFQTRDIVVYDNGVYKCAERPSCRQIAEIMKNLTDEEQKEFSAFLDQHFPEGEEEITKENDYRTGCPKREFSAANTPVLRYRR